MVKFSLEEHDCVAEGESSRRRKSKRLRKYYSDSDDEVDFISELAESEAAKAVANESASASASASVRPASEAPLSFTLTDPEVLDCTVCYESLTLPIFQCENGHIACSSCCTKLKNKCPFCTFPIGYNRCRAIEKVIESMRVLCQNSQYGCDERLRLSCRKGHEDKCIYAPCTCPFDGCNFMGSCKQLSHHCSAKHLDSVQGVEYDQFRTFYLHKDSQVSVLKEETDGSLFILNNSSEINGNTLTVKYVGPISSNRVLFYDLKARRDKSTLRLQAFMENHSAVVGTPSWFLVVPHTFFNSEGMLKVKLCIQLSSVV